MHFLLQIPPNEIKEDLSMEKFDRNKNKAKSSSKINLDDFS
jgi:hypothetical protein